jgi:AcrR family transcriptional regulator
MGSKERRDRERRETREKIFAAAREMFAQEGYEAVTMRAIADKIEYTPTTIYHHFASKQALVTELCRCDFDELAGQFARASTMADPLERMRMAGEAYIQFAIEHPQHYRFMFMTSLPDVEHDAQFLAETMGNPESDAYAFVRHACMEAIEKGLLRPELSDAHEVAQLLWATLHGMISLRINKQHEEWVPWRDLRTAARNAMDALFRGILRDPSALPKAPQEEPAMAGGSTKTK